MTRKQKRKKGKKTKSAGRFGARYGRKIRKAITAIESKTNAAHKCPKCERDSVSRVGTGIWKCSKCGFTFSGGTYIPQTTMGITAQRAINRMMDQGIEIETEAGTAAGAGTELPGGVEE